MLNKFKGALIGIAVGDALGASTEFMSKEEVKRQYGYLDQIIGGGWLNIEQGDITDDTEMTLCVANGIIKDYKNPIPEIGNEFLKWYKSKPKDIGISVVTTLRLYNGDWFKASKQSHDLVKKSAGNGTLMRCLPIALAYKDLKTIEELSIKQSKMTHYDDLAAEACVIYNRIAYKLLSNNDLKKTIEEEVKGTKYEIILNKKELDVPPDGFVINTLLWVLKTLYTTNNFSDVVEILTNAGGDADTTSAIAGGLAGIYYGYEQIPYKYKDEINLIDEIEEIATKLYKLNQGTV